jgi:Zn ribbon nucleic-acid-binding protein
MLYFNSCPKCQTGVIEHRQDPYGDFIHCVHCGFLRDMDEGTTVTDALKTASAQLAGAASASDEAVA